MTIGPIHQYLYWMLFVYYGGSDVLGSHPIGVYNWLTLFVVGMFTADMTFKTWFITCDNGKKYKEYVVIHSTQVAHNCDEPFARQKNTWIKPHFLNYFLE